MPLIIIVSIVLWIFALFLQAGVLQMTLGFFKVPSPSWKISLTTSLIGFMSSMFFVLLINSLLFLSNSLSDPEQINNWNQLGQLASVVSSTWMLSYYYNITKGRALMISIASFILLIIAAVLLFILFLLILIFFVMLMQKRM